MPNSRRDFLKLLGVIGAAAATTAVASQFTINRSLGKQVSSNNGTKIPSRYVMIIDLDRCDNCNDKEISSCLEACALMHYVPKRFKSSGEPKEPSEPQPWIEMFEKADNPRMGNYNLPRPCMHCESPPCLHVCPTGATFRTDEGVVLIDHRICIGCRMCMAACPYNARFFNWGEPEPWSPPGMDPPITREKEIEFFRLLGKYTPEFSGPHQKGTVEKCDFCLHSAKIGGLPACVSGCPEGALYYGDANEDLITNGLQETISLSTTIRDRMGFRLHEELGTKPRVYYLPKKD